MRWPFARWMPTRSLRHHLYLRRLGSLMPPAAFGDRSWPRRILVLAPHPDDEILGAGGSLALALRDDAEVHCLVCTDGRDAPPAERGEDIADLRKREAWAAGEALGGVRYTFLDHPDGALAPDAAAGEIARRAAEWNPELLLLPFPWDPHPDHRAAARAALPFLRARPGLEIWCYEVWSALPPNLLVSIDATEARKRRALREHASQLRGIDLEHHALGLNAYRALTLPPGTRFAEAFFRTRGEEYAFLLGGDASGEADFARRMDWGGGRSEEDGSCASST